MSSTKLRSIFSMRPIAIKENKKSRRAVTLASGIAIIAAGFAVCALAVLYVISFHRIQTISDWMKIYNVMRLPNHDHRCKNYNSTHFICLPNVFLIGASKCGTTTLMDRLLQHPMIDHVRRRIHKADKHREVHRFDRNTYGWASRTIEQFDEWASSPIVSDVSAAVLHYTPQYLYAPSVPFEMKNFYPKPEELKFIVVLRDPVARSLSSYWFRNSHLFKDKDQGSISEFMNLANSEMISRKKYDACMAGKGKLEIILNPSPTGLVPSVSYKSEFNSTADHSNALRHCFGSLYRSKSLGTRHIDKGIYYDQIQRWYENFPSYNFYFVSLRKFESNPDEEFSKLIKFVFGKGAVDKKRNISEETINSSASTSIHAYGVYNISFSQRRLVKPNSLSLSQVLPDSFALVLKSFYKPFNDKLEKMLGHDYL